MALFILFLLGVGLAVVPLLGVIPGLSPVAKVTMAALGVLLLLQVSIVAVIKALYRKASADVAFVRTGMGGEKVVQGGGTIVVPVIHEVIPVSLESVRVNVEGRGVDALITKDDERVDVSAEFYVKVRPNAEDILQAARSLGRGGVRPGAVSGLVREKVVSALRTVAATKELADVQGRREEFASEVRQLVTQYLAGNGLMLELMNVSAPARTDAVPPQVAGYMSGVVARG
jgi:flotillin